MPGNQCVRAEDAGSWCNAAIRRTGPRRRRFSDWPRVEATRLRCLDNFSAWFERLPETVHELIRRLLGSKSWLWDDGRFWREAAVW